jgi:hypothetical protein
MEICLQNDIHVIVILRGGGKSEFLIERQVKVFLFPSLYIKGDS